MTQLESRSRARALKNEKFICIETYSGYRCSQSDPIGVQHLLHLDVSDENLGLAVRDALVRSRFVLPREDPELYDPKRIDERYSAKVERLISLYKYKSRRDLFRNMISCDIEMYGGKIEILPSFHDQLEGWSGDGISDDDCVTLSAEDSAAAIGAALRLAFSRCK